MRKDSLETLSDEFDYEKKEILLQTLTSPESIEQLEAQKKRVLLWKKEIIHAVYNIPD